MLISIDSGKPINYTPHAADWHVWRGRLSDAQWQAISDELNRRIGAGEVHTAGWIPGKDWSGSVFQPIYENACLCNQDAAALCFGIAVWEVIRARDDHWSFGRYEKDRIPIRSLTYFRLKGAQ